MDNNINPTDAHITKLNEMCSFFYKKDFSVFEYFDTFFVNYDGRNIHWFEFCFTKLPMDIFHKLAVKDSNEGWSGDDIMFQRWRYFNDYFSEMKGLSNWINPKHPIDYLYNKFIELLNN